VPVQSAEHRKRQKYARSRDKEHEEFYMDGPVPSMMIVIFGSSAGRSESQSCCFCAFIACSFFFEVDEAPLIYAAVFRLNKCTTVDHTCGCLRKGFFDVVHLLGGGMIAFRVNKCWSHTKRILLFCFSSLVKHASPMTQPIKPRYPCKH
jgi:hypothetical protein